jgi:hypothetical protein
MKSLLFAVSLMSFVVYRAEKSEVYLQGTWKGGYVMIKKMVDVKIIFRPDNSIEFYSSEIKSGKATGFYKVSNSNKIAITCNWPDGDHISFIMIGRLGPKSNFMDGDWELNNHASGRFYLTKQF